MTVTSTNNNNNVTVPIFEKPQQEPLEFGSHLKKLFPFDENYTNLNHGSFGSLPKVIQKRFREYQDMAEANPDYFIRYGYSKLLDESRAAVANLLNAPVDEVVFVGNATEGVNTVFRNIKWADDGKDVIIYFSTAYEACAKVTDYLIDYYGTNRVSARCVELTYPLEDQDIIQAFRDAVAEIEAEGKRARICMFDVVSSRPGVAFPWVDMCRVCRELGVLSMVDGAQGVGLVKLDLSAADPDFFVSNCHKWLYAPRGCAVFYVPMRNQPMLPTTLSTSHGYVPKTIKRVNPMPPSGKSEFVSNFEFVGSKDISAYLVVKDAIAWRRDICGGEDRIMAYQQDLNKRGISYLAKELNTEILENAKGTLTNSAMGNVALPVWIGNNKGAKANPGDALVPAKDADKVLQWMMSTMLADYNTLVPLFVVPNVRFWVRLSAQIYLDMSDYEFAAKILKELCERVRKGEYLNEHNGSSTTTKEK